MVLQRILKGVEKALKISRQSVPDTGCCAENVLWQIFRPAWRSQLSQQSSSWSDFGFCRSSTDWVFIAGCGSLASRSLIHDTSRVKRSRSLEWNFNVEDSRCEYVALNSRCIRVAGPPVWRAIIKHNKQHVLHSILPSTMDTKYNLGPRPHNFKLTTKIAPLLNVIL